MTEHTNSSPADVRALIRANTWRGPTTGACAGRLQANLAVVPEHLADDFRTVCTANPRALPLLESTPPGTATASRTAPGSDLRTDLPRYHVLRQGEWDTEVFDLSEVWRDDLVAFLMGCSFSAEEALLSAGVRLRHLELGRNVAMFTTNVDCVPSGPFSGPMVVSMRPIDTDQVPRASDVTRRLPLAHGGPVHIGDPADLGIADLGEPDWGDPIDLEPGETPVFWACGVTPRNLIETALIETAPTETSLTVTAEPDIAITHAPGHMFITDIRMEDIVDLSGPTRIRSLPS